MYGLRRATLYQCCILRYVKELLRGIEYAVQINELYIHTPFCPPRTLV